jgi:hypothetical protein
LRLDVAGMRGELSSGDKRHQETASSAS